MAKPITKKTETKTVPVYDLTETVCAMQAETLEIVRKLSEHVLREDPNATVAKRIKPVRAVKCTQAAFDLLPGMVRREEFIVWTGLNDRDLTAEVRAGRIRVFKSDDESRAWYYKSEIARLTGFKF